MLYNAQTSSSTLKSKTVIFNVNFNDEVEVEVEV